MGDGQVEFYRNYQDKYDLVELIFEEAMQTLLRAVGEVGTEHPPEVWVKLFEHIAEYERLYRVLLGGKGSPWFVMKMRASLANMVKAHEPTSSRLPIADHRMFADRYIPALLSALYVETITRWLEQGRHYSPREIATRSA